MNGTLWTVEKWPLLAVCAAMMVAAFIDWWKFKVPNWLTFPIILSGWLLGLLNMFEVVPYGGQGYIGASIAGTFLACALLLPMYAIGGMGAGDVKMTMGFGAWIGAFYAFPDSMWVIFWAFCAGTVAGGFIALGMIIVRGQYLRNMQNVKEIVGTFAGSSNLGEVADKANARRPRWHRLPYGVPLCIGFVGYLIYIHGF
jgi:prepilin peptidase CpaA